jgi:hypothetical protein
MTPEMQQLLTLEFPAEHVGHRPEIWCADCKAGQWACVDGHLVERCSVCHQDVTTAHVHVSYIPHARVRERLDDVDRDWSWEPMARDEFGRPAMDGGSLWIHLTVGGKTVIGVGDAPGEVAGRGRRQAVSSAIKNAAEALGVGRYLRMQEPEQPPVQPKQLPARPVEDKPKDAAALIERIIDEGGRQRKTAAIVEAAFTAWSRNPNSKKLHSASVPDLIGFLDHLQQVKP